VGCFGGGMVLDVFWELDVRGSGGFGTFWGSGRFLGAGRSGFGRVWDFLGFWTLERVRDVRVREGLGRSGCIG
jgi:hypothetical protein